MAEFELIALARGIAAGAVTLATITYLVALVYALYRLIKSKWGD